jgi:hypothetical protein
MDRHFEQTDLQLLNDTEEVEIEPSMSGAEEQHRRTIWVVVVGSEAYARSVNGPQGRWYQALTTNSVGTIYADEYRMAVRCVPVSDPLVLSEVSEAYQRKYALYAQDVAWITGPEAQQTTLRLEPEPGHATA